MTWASSRFAFSASISSRAMVTLGGPRWLVESLWARAGVGILGGAPKCCKTWLALEMSLAVAAGAPCLGSFAVPTPARCLREVQRAHDVAILVVHHARKTGAGSHAGLSLRGSGDFFAWADSLLYMRRQHGRLLLTAEHRAAPASDPIGVMLVGERDAHLELDAEGEELPSNDAADALPLEQIVVDVLSAAEAPLTRTQLRARVKVRNERLGQVLTRLAAAGTIRRLGDRWAVPDSRSPSP